MHNFYDYLDTGVDLESRLIEFSADIDERVQSMLVRSLIKMNEISKDPITIHFSTDGGDIYNGLAIYDALRSSPSKIRAFGSGKIMSAGMLVFLAASERYASPHTRFMVHSVAQITGVAGESTKLKDMKIDVIEADALNNLMLSIIGERTKMSFNWWQKKLASHDHYFGVDRAIEYGIIKIPAERNKTAKKG